MTTGTPLSTILDDFLQLVTDYRLINLFNQSQDDFETYLESFLSKAIVDFDVCNQTLIYDATTKTFSLTLTQENITILSELMMKWWLQKETFDVTQMRLHVLDRDFKVFAESNNLKTKLEALDRIKEQTSQRLVSYGYKNTSSDFWLNQTFYVP